MQQDETPRQLGERTGRHRCVRCLAETRDEQYFRNDHICDRCADGDEYPPPERPAAPAPEPPKPR